ncbi:MAG: conjugative transposon protein TraN [Alistipes indistinctus]|nr:conjugative transposon protein TraN [Alistipes indistinctus]
MKIACLALGVLIASAGYAQEGKTISSAQSIASYRLEVTFSKTVHLIFPSAVKYVDLGSADIIAGKSDGVENVVRVKAAVEGFEEETNFSVITQDGTFYSFEVVYTDEPEILNINMDQWKTAEKPSDGGGGIQVTELGAEDPATIRKIMYTIYQQNRRDVKHIGSREFGMQSLLRGIYVHKDLLFLHVSLTNSSNVPFDVDFIRFRIVDKKVARRTAQQETIIEPVRAYSNLTHIEGHSSGHMVYAFGKITIPDDKFLEVEIYEKDGSRHQRFHIENADLVDARIIKHLKR